MVTKRYLFKRFDEISKMVDCFAISNYDVLDDALVYAINASLDHLKYYFPSLEDDIEVVMNVNTISKCAEVNFLILNMKREIERGTVRDLC